MENKVYYGEYSLDYWIQLILKKNIILPEYQRNFTWTLQKREKLIKSLKNKEFIPPVTIGFFCEEGKKENLIIDGQQRLTSILLSVLGYFPDRDAYRRYKSKNGNSSNEMIKFIDGNDDIEEVKENSYEIDVVNWSFSDLLKDENELSIKKLRDKIEKIEYFKRLNNEHEHLDETFLKNTYIGFSYLVPNTTRRGYQQEYYSSVFRNINIQGMNLSFQESRKALYYLDKRKETFFMPKFVESIEGDFKIDFVRYISILSQYKKLGSVEELCRGYGGKKDKIEEFYEEYIDIIINEKESSDFYSYDELFGSNGHEERLAELEKIIIYLKLSKEQFESIIDYDMYYFGLIYVVLFGDFRQESVDLEKWENSKKILDNQIKIYKAKYLDKKGEPANGYKNIAKESLHYKNPAALKYLRERVNSSIEIYKGMVK